MEALLTWSYACLDAISHTQHACQQSRPALINIITDSPREIMLDIKLQRLSSSTSIKNVFINLLRLEHTNPPWSADPVTKMAVLKPFKGNYYLWEYLPSLPGAIAFTIAFLLITSAQGWRMFKGKHWFCIPFFIGGVCKFSKSH
jgi:hypothetical protein